MPNLCMILETLEVEEAMPLVFKTAAILGAPKLHLNQHKQKQFADKK
mgnify:CR=1 FL=1